MLKNIFRFLTVMFSSLGTGLVLCILLAFINGGTFNSGPFSSFLIIFITVLINIIMDFVIHET